MRKRRFPIVWAVRQQLRWIRTLISQPKRSVCK